MPELPEVEVIVRGLKKNILDTKILDFNILNNKLRFPVDPNMRSLYKNRTIKYIFRRGKYGFIILDGRDNIVFHLGMTGKFRLSTNLNIKIKHVHIFIKLSNKLNLIYNDVRKFGFFLKFQILLTCITLEIWGLSLISCSTQKPVYGKA